MAIKIFLSISIWAGLPVCLYLITGQFNTEVKASEASLLFLFYLSFSWSMALMIFIIETARQRLFQALKPIYGGLKFGGYASIAALLGLLTYPDPGHYSITEKLVIVIFMVLYGCLSGYIYQRCQKPGKTFIGGNEKD